MQTSSKFKLVRFIRQKSFPMCAEAGGEGGFSSCRSVREIYQSRSQLSRQHGRRRGAATPQCPLPKREVVRVQRVTSFRKGIWQERCSPLTVQNLGELR